MTDVNPKLQEVFDAASASYQRLYAVLRGINEEQAKFKPSEYEWSVGEMAHHVARTHRRIINAIDRELVQAIGCDLAPDPDPASALHSLDQFAARADEKFQMSPKDLPEHGRPIKTTLRDLEEQEGMLRDLLAGLSNHDCRQMKFAHPTLGNLDVYQWILMLGTHASGHRKQIETVMKRPNFPA